MLTPGIMPEFQNTYGSRPSPLGLGREAVEPSGFNPECFFQAGYSTINSVNLSGGTEKNQTLYR